MTPETRAADPIVLLDVDDLAEADLAADLAERLEPAAWVSLPSDRADVRADVASLACAIRRGGAAAAAVHELGPEAAMLAG